MSNTKKWVISAIQCKPTENELTDVVSVIHWRKQATEVVGDTTYMTELFGACDISSPDPETFISFADLTEAQVISWLEATLDVEDIDASLDAKIDAEKNPPLVVKRAPWIPVLDTEG
jgi:hypothetical protein